MKIWHILASITFLFALLFFSFPNSSFAADGMCDCYCGSPGFGATSEREYKNDDAGKNECAEFCRSFGDKYLGCFGEDTIGASPVHNALCWTQSECEEYTSTNSGEDRALIWDEEQPAECIFGEHYCYDPGVEVNLGVPIGELTSATDFKEYFFAIYNIALIFVGAITIVFLMVGGFMYIVSAGNPNIVSKAKAIMSRSLLGLLLFLGAIAIGELIAPQLTVFDVFRVPKSRTIVFIDEDANCEAADAAGYDLKVLDQKICGKTCEVTGVPEDSVGTIEIGDILPWTACEDPYATCLSVAGGDDEEGDQYECIRCKEASTWSGADPVGGFAANSTNCAKLEPADLENTKFICEYSSEWENSCIEVNYQLTGNLGDMGIDCNALYSVVGSDLGSELGENGVECSFYNELLVEEDNIAGLSDDINDEEYFSILNSICGADICNFSDIKCEVVKGDQIDAGFFDFFTYSDDDYYCVSAE